MLLQRITSDMVALTSSRQTYSEAALYLVVGPRVGWLKQGRCRAGSQRRVRGIPHPGGRSRAGRNQAGAGRTEWPLECAGLHSSSVHP